MVDIDERLKEMRDLAREAEERRRPRAVYGFLVTLALLAFLALTARNSCVESDAHQKMAKAVESIERKLVTGR
jgi:hypothetical protein